MAPETQPPEALGITTNQNPFRPHVIAAYAALCTIWLSKHFGGRDLLPEPIDVVDHLSNTQMTLPLAGIAAIYAWGHKTDGSYSTPQVETDESFTRRRRIAGAAVACTSILANTYAELVGYGESSTPDPVDFGYGLLGGLIVYKLFKPNRLSADDIAKIHESDEYRQNPKEYKQIDKLVGYTAPSNTKQKHPRSKRRRRK